MPSDGLITITPDVRSGKPWAAGTRITMFDVLEGLAGGVGEDEILMDSPQLTREAIRAARPTPRPKALRRAS